MDATTGNHYPLFTPKVTGRSWKMYFGTNRASLQNQHWGRLTLSVWAASGGKKNEH
jgi:hypothetical protein